MTERAFTSSSPRGRRGGRFFHTFPLKNLLRYVKIITMTQPIEAVGNVKKNKEENIG
jgi:hypothetical protein